MCLARLSLLPTHGKFHATPQIFKSLANATTLKAWLTIPAGLAAISAQSAVPFNPSQTPHLLQRNSSRKRSLWETCSIQNLRLSPETPFPRQSIIAHPALCRHLIPVKANRLF
jgi:hypothetical protein